MTGAETVQPIKRTVDFRFAKSGQEEFFPQQALVRFWLPVEVLFRIRFKQVHEYVKHGFAHFDRPSSLCK